MAAREGTALHALAMELRKRGIVYAIHMRTGEIRPYTVDEYRSLLAHGTMLRGYRVKWSMREAQAVQAKIDRGAREN